MGSQVRVGVVDEPELVTTGLGAMLAQHASRATLAPLEEADVVLCDPVGRAVEIERYLAEVAARTPARLVVWTWRLDSTGVRRAVGAGACGVVSKAAPATDLVRAVVAAHRGERVRTPALPAAGSDGLSTREAEVLRLICRGRSNLEIAAELYVSVNSVKTYIRQIYQKIGVSRRSQAVAWGIGRGY